MWLFAGLCHRARNQGTAVLKGQHREGVAQGSLPTGTAVSEGVAPLPSHPDPTLLSQEGPRLTQCTFMCTFSTPSTEREEQVGT